MFCWVQDLVLHFLNYIMNYFKCDSHIQQVLRLIFASTKILHFQFKWNRSSIIPQLSPKYQSVIFLTTQFYFISLLIILILIPVVYVNHIKIIHNIF